MSEHSLVKVDQIVVFDGDCTMCGVFCTWVVERLMNPKLAFVASQSPLGELALNCIHAELTPETVILTGSEGSYFRGDAVIRIMRQMRAPWRQLAGILACSPAFLRDGVYNCVARHRRRLFPQKGQCRLPSRFGFLLLDGSEPASEAMVRRIFSC